MKPFQFYLVKDFQKPAVGKSLRNQVQTTFSGEAEDVDTVITVEVENYEGGLDLLRVKSEIRHQTVGFIKTLVGSKREKIQFIEYLQPVDFPAYFHKSRNLMIFQAPKKECSGVLGHLRTKLCGIELIEVELDFGEVLKLNNEYLGAWFRGASSRVQAVGMSGNQIQDDSLFKNLQQVAELSNVTIPWMHNGVRHPVMLTSRGGVVLVQNYQDIGLELELVMDVQEKLLQKVWHERTPHCKTDQDMPNEA
jgi:hypothetical protein